MLENKENPIFIGAEEEFEFKTVTEQWKPSSLQVG